MIVIRRPMANPDDTPDVIYKVAKDNKGITFNFETTYQNIKVKRQVVLDFDTYKGKILQISLQRTHQIELRISPMYEMVSRYYTMSENNNEAYILARVSIAPDCKDVVVFLQRPTNYECPDAEKNIEFNPQGYTKAGIIKKYSPWYSERCDCFKRKYAMMMDIDIYNSVTYLESQVDALTRLVLELVKNGNSDCMSILREADKHSVLDIKNVEKILNEIKVDKAHVRAKQKEYYGKA